MSKQTKIKPLNDSNGTRLKTVKTKSSIGNNLNAGSNGKKSVKSKKDTAVRQIKSKLNSNLGSNERPWSVFGSELRDEATCQYTHVSLFSGCGGVDLGFRQAGFKTVFANDLNADACNTYRNNLGEIVEGDLRQIIIPKLKKRPDVLTAGFPCQPFSNAGSRKGTSDSRGNLFQTAIDVVEKLRPKVVVFENVRGLLSFKNGDRLLIEDICTRLDDLGYDMVFGLIDASKHNVPQKRLRVLMVGVEKAKKLGTFSFPISIERTDLALKDTIMDIPENALNQSELMQLNPQAIHIGSMVPEGGSWKNIPYDKLPPRLQRIWDNIERYRWPNFYRRFHRDEVAGTITAAFKPENAGVWHPTKKRIFSVREIARIQSFPDWFKFESKTIKSKYQMIGNAVPPRLAYEIAQRILGVLRGENQRESKEHLTFDKFIKSGKPLRARDNEVIFVRDSRETKKAV